MKWSLPTFAVFLAVALTAFLWPSIFGGRVLLPLDIMANSPPFAPDSPGVHNGLIADMVLENFPWKTFQRESFAHGEWPLWTPESFCGHPIYTTGQTSTFYPLNAIFMLIPVPQAYVLFTWLHLFMGGIFTYLFLRRVGVTGFGASAGGILFAMCTFFAVRFIWPMLLGSAVWLPLMLLWIDRMTEPRNLRSFLAGLPVGALLFAMPILSGFFEIAFYVLSACALYAFYLGIQLVFRERNLNSTAVFWGKVGTVTLAAALISAPQLLPFFEVMKRNVRSGELTYADAIRNGLTWQEGLTFLSPDVLGNPSKHWELNLETRQWQPIRAKTGQDFHYFGPVNYVESTNYLGLLPLAFASLSILAPGRRRLFFWLLLALSLALAFATPLYWVFYHLVPGTDQLRTPFRWTLLTMFACTYLAAIGADDWRARLASPARRFTRVVATAKLLAVFILVLVMVVLFLRPAPLAELAERIMAAEPRAAGVFADPMSFAGQIWLNAARFIGLALVAMLLIVPAYWRAWGPKSVALFSLLALVFITLDLGQATYRFNTHADPAILDQVPPIVQHLQDESRKDIFRMGRFGWQRMFAANLPNLFGIQDYGGYDSIILTPYARYLEAIEHQKQLPYNIVMTCEQKSSLDSPLYSLLNIRYLVSVKPLDHPDWDPVDVAGNLKLSRIKPEKEVPRAFMVNQVRWVLDLEQAIETIRSGQIDVRRAATVETVVGHASHLVSSPAGPPGQATIVDYRPSRVHIETSAPSRQLLVLCDVHYPGWRGYVDGRPTDIITTNGIFRGISVPAGRHMVEFRFEPAPFRIGATLSLACLAGLAVIQAVLWGRRLRGENPAVLSVKA